MRAARNREMNIFRHGCSARGIGKEYRAERC
jgi:hypothetical protein